MNALYVNSIISINGVNRLLVEKLSIETSMIEIIMVNIIHMDWVYKIRM